MKIGTFEFKGPFLDIEGIEDDAGLYVVLSLHPDGAFEIIDVGEGGWNFPTGRGIKKRLKSHNRRPCWERYLGGGSLAFAVFYERDGEKRLKIEEELRQIFRPPCGTYPWHIQP
jgi:hypothetical protein